MLRSSVSDDQGSRTPTLQPEAEQRFFRGLEETARFFMGQSRVHKALEKLVAALDAGQIPYAIVGALALNEAGYQRATVDVDVLLSPSGSRPSRRQTWAGDTSSAFPAAEGFATPKMASTSTSS